MSFEYIPHKTMIGVRDRPILWPKPHSEEQVMFKEMSRNRRMRDLDLNPCIKETDASSKCMDENNYRKEMCTLYFIKYKNCRKFWNDVMMHRKRDGVTPYMPTAEERENMLNSLGRVPY
uniref:Coiled-coil-helix-coiled-coil-helix domain-containing protein 7 n=1 Tax=Leptobrachium leishanense TaxID=445787 RepID=A0A8C5PBJ7_9ANUR